MLFRSVIVHASNPPAFLFATSNGGKVSDFSTVMDSVILSAAAPMFSGAVVLTFPEQLTRRSPNNKVKYFIFGVRF